MYMRVCSVWDRTRQWSWFVCSSYEKARQSSCHAISMKRYSTDLPQEGLDFLVDWHFRVIKPWLERSRHLPKRPKNPLKYYVFKSSLFIEKGTVEKPHESITEEGTVTWYIYIPSLAMHSPDLCDGSSTGVPAESNGDLKELVIQTKPLNIYWTRWQCDSCR